MRASRTKFRDAIAHALDRLHAVVQEIDLALPFQLAIDRVANDALVVAANNRFDRQPIERRRLDRRHVFHADERKIKRARNRRRRKREHIDEFEKLLELFFMQNAEALFFVDDDQTQILENDIAGNEPMRADDNVDAAFAQQLPKLCAARLANESG